MDYEKLKKRDSSLDILRIIAVFTVLSVHFFLHNGFYSQTVEDKPMYIAVVMRTLFSVCVPLFMLLTGYLMSKKELSKKYYSGITKTLVVFVISTLACMIYKNIAQGDVFDLKSFILGTLDFTGSNYSWYIEMYIGLFLLAPFLNLAYGKLKNKRQKQVLLITVVFLTIVPSLFNIFNFGSLDWWTNPTSSDEFQKLVPSWWQGFYPIAYYFVGCYIREYGLKMKTRTMLILFVFSLFLFSTFNFFRSYGTTFKSGTYIYWYGFEPFVLSVLLFLLIKRIKTENMPKAAKVVLWKVSDLALGIYLISFIFDSIVYPILCEKVILMPDRLPFYFVTVPIVFVLSAAASFIMNLVAKILIDGFKSAVKMVRDLRSKPDKGKYQHIIFAVLMALAIGFSLWKCYYGFGGNDESFYLTIPHRLTLGDSLLGDEWHLTQLSGFLLLPFVWLYTTITQSTVGIILAARIFYVICHAVVVCIIYSRLKKYGYFTVFGCVLYFLFTPFDIMALSYNTMGLDLIALTGVLMATADYSKKLPLIISGLAFAGAVLCCPYLAAAYVLYLIAVGAHCLIKKTPLNKNVFNSDLFSIKTFLWFTLGAGILAVIFIVFVLSRVSINEIFTNLPYLMADPDHPQMGFMMKMNYYFKTIVDCHSHFKYVLMAYGATAIVMILDRKRKQHRSIYLILTSAIVILALVMFMPTMTSVYYNAIMFPMIFMSITAYVLSENKNRELFASLFILGILYSVALCFSSNQYFFVTAMACSASNIAGFVFVGNLIKEMKASPDNLDYAVPCKYFAFGITAFLIVLQACFQITVKAEHCFWESSPSQLSQTIQDGPAKGIKTTSANAENYGQLYNDINEYQSLEKGNILFLTQKTWTYLAAKDFPYGTLSAYVTGENQNSLDRLRSYYSVNSKKIPKYIYIPKDSQWENIQQIVLEAQQNGYTLSENTVSYKLQR